MIYYSVSAGHAHRQLISFEMRFDVKKNEEVLLQLPTWRPGRYELADYASNIFSVTLVDNKGNDVAIEKTEQHVWSFKSKVKTEVVFSYQFHASVINAGSSFIDETQLYINPVNCFFYLKGRESESYEVRFDIPPTWELEGMLPYKGDVIEAKDMDELFDSPFIASDSMLVHRFKEAGVNFSVVIQGNARPDWKQVEKDFRPFIKAQVKAFGSCPVKDYTFLIQAPDVKQYHGVEHEKGTVLALGPANELMRGKTYYDLLAVSSHEFYHTWNVKNIRPEEMMPYDFSKENYHRIGYIIEGVTTYQGDLKLWQSGVMSDAEFMKELQTHLDRHLSNDGRTNMSVRESSFDTWVDGYVKGAPGRKVSIYTEGALVAMITDIELIRRTKGKHKLDEVMKRLYNRYGKNKRRGYSEASYLEILNEVGGKGTADVVKRLVDAPVSYEKAILAALKTVGLKVKNESVSIMASYFGIQLNGDETPTVVAVHSDSEAYEIGVRPGMKIIGVEGHVVKGNLEQWVSHFKGTPQLNFLVQNGARYADITIGPSAKLLFRKHTILPIQKKPNEAMKSWKKV